MRNGDHPNTQIGKRHIDKLMILLSDYKWHSYYEIITTLRIVNADRRLRNLRADGVELEESTARVNEHSHPYKIFKLKDSEKNNLWFEEKLQIKERLK